MLTPWGESVTAENVWPEYPRPQFVRERWQNLNGRWQYAIRPRTDAMPEIWDGEILVPFCVESALSGVAQRLSDSQRLWYRRTFTPDTPNARSLLHFGAVDYHAALWINGAFVASHSGGFDAFTVDITNFLREGANELIVCADDPTSASDQPRGKQHLNPQGIWYTPVTGIWQTVWLEPVPLENSIAEIRLTPQLDTECVVAEVLLARPSRDPTLAVTLTARLGRTVVATLIGRPDRLLSLNVPAPQLWSPDNPALYDLEVALVRVADPSPATTERRAAAGLLREMPLRGQREADLYASARAIGAPLDVVSTYFGMRSIAVGSHPHTGEPTLLLNGSPVFHLATLDQGWWPDGPYTPPADAALVYEIEFLKAAGFNAARKHIKVEPARYYYHCDRLGLLVWQDMPSGFLPAQFVAPNDEAEGLRSSASTQVFENELTRMIRALRSHPSIVVWVLHNEGWGQFDSARLTAAVRSIDPTRVIDAGSGWLDLGAGDLIDRHDYAPEPTAPAPDERRARVIGEFGGLGWPVEGHLWNPHMRNWGYQTFRSAADLKTAYVRTTAAVGRAMREDGVCAAVYTQTTDVEGEVNGLLTYDRRVEKIPRAWLAATHASFK